MPQIPQFEADAKLVPSQTGVDATAMAGRRVGLFYNQQASAERQLAAETDRLGAQTEQLGREKANLITGEGARLGSSVAAAGDAAVKLADHDQISQGGADYAKLLADKTAQWNALAASPDAWKDPNLARKFMATLEPDLDNFQKGMTTEGAQQWAQAHAAALRQHFVEKTQGDMSLLAGQRVRMNVQQTVNSLSNTVHDDPTSVGFALAALQSSTEGLLSTSPNLSAAEAAQVRGEEIQKGSEAIVKSAAIGHIALTGQVPDWVNDPKFQPYVNGQELQMFARQARVQQHYDAVAQKQGALLQQQLDERAAKNAIGQNFADNVAADPVTGHVTIKPDYFTNALDIVRKYPGAASEVKTYLSWGEAQQKGEKIASDPTAMSALDDRMFAPDNPVTKLDILKAEAAGKLSRQDGALRMQMVEQRDAEPIKNPLFHDAIAAARGQIETTMGGGMKMGTDKYIGFMQQFLTEYMRESREGKLPPNALDLNDPNSLISKTIAPYRSPLAQSISANGGVGGSRINTGPVSTSPPVAGAKLYQGKWYTRGPGGEAVPVQ